jgi:hypothetical protein
LTNRSSVTSSKLVDSTAFKNLEAHQAKLVRDGVQMRQLFAADADRFAKFSLHFEREAEFRASISGPALTASRARSGRHSRRSQQEHHDRRDALSARAVGS